MARSSAPFRVRLLGPPEHPRYIVRDARRLVDHFWTGKGWSHRLRDARLFADPNDVARTVKRLTLSHLQRQEAKQLFLLTVVVTVHAPEEVSRQDVEHYLQNALIVGMDYQKYGTGLTEDSLVEVVLPPVISLEGR